MRKIDGQKNIQWYWMVFNHFGTSTRTQSEETVRSKWRDVLTRAMVFYCSAICHLFYFFFFSFLCLVCRSCGSICSKSIEIGFCGLSRSIQVIKKTLICREWKQVHNNTLFSSLVRLCQIHKHTHIPIPIHIHKKIRNNTK